MIVDDYCDLIQAIAGGRPVIVGNDNGKRPAKPYAAVFLNLARPMPAHHGATDDDGNRYVESHRPGRLLLHCYGDGSDAFELADTISMGLMTQASIEAAILLNISWMSQPTLESVPALMDNGDYEDRAILTIETAYTASILENVGVIETVEVTAETEPAVTGPEIIIIDPYLS